uniref:Uncharacterized protein n=1 Tax=Nelumbo nucifera TaxID=4432 RepID=A0A822YGW0_NELNU|nr:TPA_asm: hypothetical protein HUJ06_010523 [Nelumbo nucifera]
MASLSSSPLVSNPQWRTNSRSCRFCTSHYFLRTPSSVFLSSRRCQGLSRPIITSQLCTQELVTIDRSALVVAEAFSEEQLWAAACLRVRSFNEFQESYGVQVSFQLIDLFVFFLASFLHEFLSILVIKL